MTDAERAKLAHPHSGSLQAKWTNAIKYLRSGRGWVADGRLGFMMRDAEVAPVDPIKASKVVPIRRQK